MRPTPACACAVKPAGLFRASCAQRALQPSKAMRSAGAGGGLFRFTPGASVVSGSAGSPVWRDAKVKLSGWFFVFGKCGASGLESAPARRARGSTCRRAQRSRLPPSGVFRRCAPRARLHAGRGVRPLRPCGNRVALFRRYAPGRALRAAGRGASPALTLLLQSACQRSPRAGGASFIEGSVRL